MTRHAMTAGWAVLALAGQAHAVAAGAAGGATPVAAVEVTKPLKAAHDAFDPQEVVCRVEPRPGSRIARDRLCLTRAGWTEVSRRSADTLEKIQTASDTSPLP